MNAVEAWRRKGIILEETFAVVLIGSNSSCKLYPTCEHPRLCKSIENGIPCKTKRSLYRESEHSISESEHLSEESKHFLLFPTNSILNRCLQL
jgi:hypothetical protein